MKLYIGSNGDASVKIYVFANDEASAREIGMKEIKQEGYENSFPVLVFTPHEVKEGFIEMIDLENF
jgi:hypothetical protein